MQIFGESVVLRDSKENAPEVIQTTFWMLIVSGVAVPDAGALSKPNSITTPPGMMRLRTVMDRLAVRMEGGCAPCCNVVQGTRRPRGSCGSVDKMLWTGTKIRGDVSPRDYLTKLSLDAQSAEADLLT